MNQLNSSTAKDFLDQFCNCYDSLLRSIKISMPPDYNINVLISLSVRDQRLSDATDHGWINLNICVKELSEFALRQLRKMDITVLSDGLHIGFFNDEVYLDFFPGVDEPKTIEEFRKSDCLFVGKTALWEVVPYSEIT